MDDSRGLIMNAQWVVVNEQFNINHLQLTIKNALQALKEMLG